MGKLNKLEKLCKSQFWKQLDGYPDGAAIASLKAKTDLAGDTKISDKQNSQAVVMPVKYLECFQRRFLPKQICQSLFHQMYQYPANPLDGFLCNLYEQILRGNLARKHEVELTIELGYILPCRLLSASVKDNVANSSFVCPDNLLFLPV